MIHFRKYSFVYIYLALSILFAASVYTIIRRFEHQYILKTYREETLKRKSLIEAHILENISTLKIVKAYIQKNRSISRFEFSNIVSPIVESNQSIQAIEWVPKVGLAERKEYETKAKIDGFGSFYFKEFDKKRNITCVSSREFYYPIYYIEPLASNENALGFDLSTRSFTQEKLKPIIEKYGLAFTDDIKLIQDSLEYGFGVYFPVYGVNDESGSCKKDIAGFVACIYKTSVLIKHVLNEFPQDYTVQIYSKTDSLNEKLLYSLIPSGNKPLLEKDISDSSFEKSEYVNRYTINIANFSWELIFISAPQNKFWSISTVVLLIVGLIAIFITIILFLNKKAIIKIKLSNQQLNQELIKRIEYEKELKLSRDKFSKLFFLAPLPITYVRLNDRVIVDVNLAFEKLFGYSKNSILGKTTKDIGFYCNVEDWNNYYSIFSKNGVVNYLEADVKTINGEVKRCLVSGRLIQVKEHDFIYTFYQDITIRKNTELALQQSESKYREIFNSVNDAIFIYNGENQTIEDANKKAIEMFKYSLGEFKNIDLIDFTSVEYPFVYEELKRRYNNLVESNSAELIEWKAKDKEGKIFWVEISYKVVLIDSKKKVLCVVRDVSESKKIEKLLIENEFLFRTQFNNSNIGITISTSEKLYVRANKKFCDIVGYSEEELQKKLWSDITYSDDIGVELPFFNKFLSGEQDAFEMDKRYIHKNGGVVHAQLLASCFRNSDGSIHYIISNIFNISDRIEMENKILKAVIETEENEKTRFAQELHDGLGPILSSIKMYIQWMEKPNANLDRDEGLKHIENLIGLAHQSLREVAFGLSPHILKDFGITEALKSFTNKIKGDETPSIIINSNLTSRLNETVETIIYRILIECINNSLKHSHGNLIVITLKLNYSMLNIDYYDNGVGFDLGEITDKKMGLGLYNILNRLKSINGDITINTQHGQGFSAKINIKL